MCILKSDRKGWLVQQIISSTYSVFIEKTYLTYIIVMADGVQSTENGKTVWPLNFLTKNKTFPGQPKKGKEGNHRIVSNISITNFLWFWGSVKLLEVTFSDSSRLMSPSGVVSASVLFGESLFLLTWLCFSLVPALCLCDLVYPNKVTSVSPWKYPPLFSFYNPQSSCTIPHNSFWLLTNFLSFSTCLLSITDMYSQPVKTLSKRKPF